jgi:hypothetical protein
MTAIAGGGTGSIGQLLNQGMSQISQKSQKLETKMTTMMNKEGGMTHDDAIRLQFEMSQYTASMESLSSVTKSLGDTLKSMAQKAG